MDSSEVRGSEFVQRLGEASEKISVVESRDLCGMFPLLWLLWEKKLEVDGGYEAAVGFQVRDEEGLDLLVAVLEQRSSASFPSSASWIMLNPPSTAF